MRASGLLGSHCSRAATQHRTKELVEITEGVVSTTVTPRIPRDPTGMAHTSSHRSKLDQGNHAKGTIPGMRL